MDKAEKVERIKLHREFWEVIKQNKNEFFLRGYELKVIKVALFDKFYNNNKCKFDVINFCFVCARCENCLVTFNDYCDRPGSYYKLWVQSIREKNSEDFDKYCDLIKNAPEAMNITINVHIC
ncbi:MAG: hypothetical protein EHM12_11195 [Dehalococcoidia bacterium]|nr:MAG: hypothetical protein EHM12_11195 [Dehalococcoidia bacterium]